MQILSLSIDNVLAPKYDYLVNEIGSSAADIVSYPAYFSLSLTGRIKPRHEFLRHLALKSNTLTASQCNIDLYVTVSQLRFPLSLLALTDEKFCQRLGLPDDREYQVFKKDHGSLG